MKARKVKSQCSIEALAGFAKTLMVSLMVLVSFASMAQDTPQTVDTVDIEKVNINRADASTIARILEGVGQSRAEAIVSFREQYGEFTSEEDLMMVRGVGEVTLRNNAGKIDYE